MKFFKNLLIESLIENVACKYLPALTSAITVISQIKRDIYLIHKYMFMTGKGKFYEFNSHYILCSIH